MEELHWVYVIQTVPDFRDHDEWVVPCPNRSYAKVRDFLAVMVEDLLDRGDDDPEFTMLVRLQKWPLSAIEEVDGINLDEFGPATLASIASECELCGDPATRVEKFDRPVHVCDGMLR